MLHPQLHFSTALIIGMYIVMDYIAELVEAT